MSAAALATREPAAAAASAIYVGRIRHRRHAPRPHAFSYGARMLLLDLDELDHAFAGRWFWSVNRRNLAAVHRSDYLGDPRAPLADAVRARIRESLGEAPAGPIRLLTLPRYFGYCFNPVSFYYAHHADGHLACIVAEITNTPWGERHAYVLPVSEAQARGTAHEWSFDKRFHVSPFLPMARRYRWRFTAPGERLAVHMDVLDGETPQFDATLSLERRPFDAAGLARCLLALPPTTFKVIAAIHWQALLIWLKRNPVYDHPSKSAGSFR